MPAKLTELQAKLTETAFKLQSTSTWTVERSKGVAYGSKWLIRRNGDILAAFDYSSGVEKWLEHCRKVGGLPTPTKSECCYRNKPAISEPDPSEADTQEIEPIQPEPLKTTFDLYAPNGEPYHVLVEEGDQEVRYPLSEVIDLLAKAEHEAAIREAQQTAADVFANAPTVRLWRYEGVECYMEYYRGLIVDQPLQSLDKAWIKEAGDAYNELKGLN